MFLISKIVKEIKKYPKQRLIVFSRKAFCGFGHNDERIEIAKRLGFSTRVLSSLSEIGWRDIFFRRIFVARIPPRDLMKTSCDKWKRRFLRFLGLCASRELCLGWLYEALLLNHGDKTLFTVSPHVAQIYAAHLPGFKVIQVVNEKDEAGLQKNLNLLKRVSGWDIDKRPGVTVFANITMPVFIRAYRFLHPNRRIVLRFHDLIKAGLGMDEEKIVSFVDVLRKEGVIDEVEAYDRLGAKALKGRYRPNGADPDFILSLDVLYREYLYNFIGTSGTRINKMSRLRNFAEVYDEVELLYPKSNRWRVTRNHDLTAKWLPYNEFAKISAHSEVYIDLYRLDPEEGFSFRIPEALWLNRKIISNRLLLREELFYSPERVFLIGVDPLSRLRDFLETDIEPLPNEILQFYDTRLWWTEEDPVQEIYQ